MKKITSIVAATLATVACFGAFTACNQTELKTVTIGYTEYAPMNYKNEAGELVGFDTELAEMAFADLGYEVRFKLIEWSNKYGELDSGAVDCLWNGFTANCADDDGVQRSEKVDFSYYYMTNAQCVIRLNTADELTDAGQLAGKSVAFEDGSAGDSYASAVAGINEKASSSQMAAVLEVRSGAAQYAVIDLLLAQSIAGKGDYASVVINEGIAIDAEYYAIGFKKGSDLTAKINEKLIEYAKDGTLMELAEKYNLENQVLAQELSEKK